jgi:hypothetical protein
VTQKSTIPTAEPTSVTTPALSMFGYDFPSDKFVCHGFSWRYDCYFPWDLKNKFEFKDKISCQSITQAYLFNANSQYDGLQYNATQTDKQFTLERKGNTLLQPTGAGVDHDTQTPYSILQDTNDTLQASRTSKDIEGNTGKATNYDSIIVSKSTGRGIEVWQTLNGLDTITSQYFQCK